jgi:hypothetical protein
MTSRRRHLTVIMSSGEWFDPNANATSEDIGTFIAIPRGTPRCSTAMSPFPWTSAVYTTRARRWAGRAMGSEPV